MIHSSNRKLTIPLVGVWIANGADSDNPPISYYYTNGFILTFPGAYALAA